MGSSEKRVVLREYQSQAVADLRKILPRHKRIVAVSPTGSGKTVIAAALIALLPKRARVVWVAHRIELLRQARAQLIAAGLPEVGILSGAYETNASARVIVASIDMLRGATVAADLVVVDEAHRVEAASYRALLDSLPRALVLGLTATPWRLDGKGLGETFASLYTVAGPTELIADGFIARPATYGVPREKARAMLRGVRSSGGDFSPAALGAAMQKKTLMGNVVKECARLAPGVPTLVFAANRDHGRALAARFANAGRPTVYLDGETPSAERAQIVDDLRAGRVEVVVNVDVLAEGFDCPPVKCIAMCRPTKSLTRFLQYAGRASRPYRGKRPIILDHAGNTWRHGMPEAEREWTLDDAKSDDSSGEAPARQCESCGAMNAIAASECVECGALLGPTVCVLRSSPERANVAWRRFK